MNESLDALLQPARSALAPALFNRVRAHLYSQLLCLGRHTVTGLLCTQGRIHQDWSADYRLYSAGRLDPETLFGCVRQAVVNRLKPNAPLVVALDDTLLRKRGPRVHGVRWTRDPLGPPFAVNLVRAQRVVQFSAALPSSAAQARLIPIDFTLAPPAPKPPKDADEATRLAHKAQAKAQSINVVAAARLTHLTAQTPDRPLVTVCDGRFANRVFLRSAPPTSTVLTRIRKDSVLFKPVTEQPPTGRRRIYGERAPTPEALRVDEATPWQRVTGYACGVRHEFKLKVLPMVLSPMQGAKACQAVVIAPLGYRLRKGSRMLYRQPAFLLGTDPKLSLRQLLAYYLWRWDIEVNFRDEKTLLGVGQAQVRTPESAQRVPAAAVAAYGLLLAAAAHAFPNPKRACAATTAPLFPPPRWRAKQKPPRPSTSALLDRLRFELFAHALKPGSFTGFWSAPPADQIPSKLPVNLATSLFHLRN